MAFPLHVCRTCVCFLREHTGPHLLYLHIAVTHAQTPISGLVLTARLAWSQQLLCGHSGDRDHSHLGVQDVKAQALRSGGPGQNPSFISRFIL